MKRKTDVKICKELSICDEEYNRLLKFITERIGDDIKAKQILENALHCRGAFEEWTKQVPSSLYKRLCILTGWRYFKEDEIKSGHLCTPTEIQDPIDEKYGSLTIYQRKLIDSYLKQFPFLNTEQDKASLIQLVKLETALEEMAQAIANGEYTRTKTQDIKRLVESIISLKHSLGIAGKDRLDYLRQSEASSIADLVELAKELSKNPEFYSAKEDMIAEELLILIQRIRRGEAHKNIVKILYNISYEDAVNMLKEMGLVSRDGVPIKSRVEHLLGYDALENILKASKRS